MQKKSYSAPRLIVHGDLAKLTLNGNASNRDTPGGPSNTAFPDPS